MTHLLAILAVMGWSLCAAGLAWYCLNIARQITYVTLADGRVIEADYACELAHQKLSDVAKELSRN